jgi:2-oxoglutarate ferredoxin oxidoreductase subunit beta
MNANLFDNQVDNQWCPGCPNFGILNALKTALTELGKTPAQVCIVSGIGQAAKLPHYLNCNFFNGLHGRAIPVATAINAANPELTTLVVTGDGDGYGEGGNHFLHMLRRNPDICVIVHNNELYALTKGQASPTTPTGEQRTLPAVPVESRPLNMLAVAIVHHTPFVARGYAGDMNQLKEIFKEGIHTRGLSVIEVLQPCITWGGHPMHWYKERIHRLDNRYNPEDRGAALKMVMEEEGKLATGVLFRSASKPLFAERFRKTISDRPMHAMPAMDISAFADVMAGYTTAG